MDDLSTQCVQKSNDFEARQGLRTDELAAIDKAIEILSSGTVSGNSEKYLPSLAQKKVGVDRHAFRKITVTSGTSLKCNANLQHLVLLLFVSKQYNVKECTIACSLCSVVKMIFAGNDHAFGNDLMHH